MQMQDQGRCGWGHSGAHRRNVGGKSMAQSFRMKLSFVLFLAAGCPGALMATEQALQAGPKLPVPPPTIVHAGAAVADFSFAASPTAIKLKAGGAAEELSVSAAAENGFHGTVTVKVGKLPDGVTATPDALTLAAGGKQSIRLTASIGATPGSFKISVSGVSGAITHADAVSVEVSPSPTTATLNTLLFDFGNNLVNNKLVQTAVVITNTGKAALTLSPALSGDPSYSIVTAKSCGASLAAGKSCDEVLEYLPTKASYPKAQDATLNLNFGNAVAGVPGAVAILGVSAVLRPGAVSSTANPQVALYTMQLPFPGQMKVNFGTTTAYGMKTWYQSTEVNHGTISMLVAGMKGSTKYHMSAYVVLSNGIVVNDTDHVFITGPVPPTMVLSVTASTAAGMTPNPGVEMLNPYSQFVAGLVVTDLAGNTLWTYPNPSNQENAQGVKMLPNGNILVAIGVTSSDPLTGPLPPGSINEIREIDLAGDTVREISIEDLNALLETATCAECRVSSTVPLTLLTFHHDVTPLPNGHWLVLGNIIEKLSTTTTPPLTNLPTQDVLGDVIVDLDENMNPVWVWNEFNHLDPNRHPYMFPDWTHTNALLYSKDDGDIIVSMRHQNWVVKVNYHNGSGDGKILWTLGEGGTFKLEGGTDPTDWMYAQHDPGYFSPNTSGVFSLGLMDNGDDRLYPKGSACTPQSGLPTKCLYSTIPVFKIDEVGKTATLTFHQKLAPVLYSFFGGNTEELANGHVEYDLCGGPNTTSAVYEVTQEKDPQTVWNMQLTSGHFYRAFRIPSLYPGVQW
jgi:arylsulfate sulfotransferase